MKVGLQSKLEYCRSTLNREIVCSLSDLIPDIESRIDFCISCLEGGYLKLSKFHVQCVSSFLINQFAQKEKGIYLSRNSLQKIFFSASSVRSFCWLRAQKILLDYGSAVSIFQNSYSHLSFSECCLHSLNKVYQSTLSDLNYFLRRILCYCLSLAAPNWLDLLGEQWITHLFELSRSIALNICEKYETSNVEETTDCFLFSLSPFAIAGTSLAIALKYTFENILKMFPAEKICVSSILFNAYVDCLTFFCHCSFTEERIISIYSCCLNLHENESSSGSQYIRFPEKNKKRTFFKESGLVHCFFSCFSVVEARGDLAFSKRISFRDSYFNCFDNRIFFQKFIHTISRKRKRIVEVNEVPKTNSRNNVFEEADDRLKSLYFNDDEYICKKRMLLREIGDKYP